ncbi:MAG: c-type cytochrome [Methyloceanibacter sp.]
MKYYYLNKIAMAVLVALLLFFGTRTLINIAFEEHKPEKPGLEVAGTEEGKKPGGEMPGGAQLATLLAEGSAEKGADVFKKCAICHNAEKGGPNMIGPNLYGVLGRKIASHEGYDYSPALKSKEGDWDYEKINAMIEHPNVFAPGTKMALFPGLPDAKQRADVILFLREHSEKPLPLPEAPAAEEAPAGEAAKPEGEAGKAEGGGFAALVTAADPKKGESAAGLCKVCHTFEKGGAAMVGPNLYGIVGHKIASHKGFNYTPALKAHEGEWNYDNLDAWLKNPQAFAPGTTMAFPGIPDDKKRADVVAFLRANADTPLPLPEAGKPAEGEKPAAEKPAPAEGEKPAAEEPAPTEPEKPAAEEPAPAEPQKPAAEEPAAPAEPEKPAAEEPAVPAEPEKPAVEKPIPAEPKKPAAEEPAPEPEEPAAEEPAAPAEPQKPAAEEPAPAEPEEPAAEASRAEAPPAATPTVSEDAPSERSVGEPPSESQPQPVYPGGPPEGLKASPSEEPAAEAPAAKSEVPTSEPSSGGEAPSSQPQPFYPNGVEAQ